ncbi:MAG: hypothetical protein ACK2U9_03775, partial [Anaerolineae bacterium]
MAHRTFRALFVVVVAGLVATSSLAVTGVDAGPFRPARSSLEADPVWRFECVDCPQAVPRVGERSLALDSSGNPHVVYGGDELYYAWFDGNVWHSDVVDEAPGSWYGAQAAAALDLDAGDRPHVAYLNGTGTAVRYAHKAADGWHVDTVATSTPNREISYAVGLRLDRAGHPLIAYSVYGELNLASWTGTRWDIQPVDHTSWVEWYISLDLDGDDRPRISYFWVTSGRSELRYAWQTDGQWTIETVDQAVWLGEYNSLALDSQGMPHISYLDATHSQLKAAQRTPAGWQIEVIDDVRWPGGFTSIALDSIGLPHVTYAGPDAGVRYAQWTGASWQLETLAGSGQYTSLALDNTGQPHMVYFDTPTRNVTYGWRGPAGWNWQEVDHVVEPGRYVSLAVDGAGDLAVAYYESSHGDLRFARRTGDTWQV